MNRWGIPAWLELGVLYDPGQRVWIDHAWMGVYIPTYVNGVNGYEIFPIDVVNFEFGWLDPYRMVTFRDDGGGGALDAYYRPYGYTSGVTAEVTPDTERFVEQGVVRIPVSTLSSQGVYDF